MTTVGEPRIMLRLRVRCQRITRRGDSGIALVAAVMVLTVLTAFSMVLLQQTVRDAGASKRDQNWAAALAAAQAGIDDYQSWLNRTDGAYYEYNTGSPDPTNSAMGQTSGMPN